MVIYNLPATNNPDDLDTQKSALAVVDGLHQAGYEAEDWGIKKEEIEEIKKLRTDLVFNLIEWAGKDYQLGVRVLEILAHCHLPYTGSHAWGYKASGNKVLMKKLMVENGILTPKYQIFSNLKSQISNLNYPLIVKPVYEHAAIGISQKSVVMNESELSDRAIELIKEFQQPVLVEEYIDGDEAQVTVLEKQGEPWVLPPAVFKYQKKAGYWPINTYEAKWGEGWEAKMSAWVDGVDKRIEIEIERLARECYLKLGGRSYPRVDMRLGADRVYVLEVNNNPGIDFDPDSGITVSAQKAGLTWSALLANIVEEAFRDAAVV